MQRGPTLKAMRPFCDSVLSNEVQASKERDREQQKQSKTTEKGTHQRTNKNHEAIVLIGKKQKQQLNTTKPTTQMAQSVEVCLLPGEA